ncbi:hypothetical protein [Methylorubrum sp. POS3]|uniref:hypothetical protein n=1 Tax=Methylorubrum sp. POS3 TaxID=2998492 RepID=UPI0037279263
MSDMSSSELPVRLEKLHFLTEDLRLAFTLSRAAPDAWTGRLVARHILIRAYDVIAHSRLLRRLAQPYGSVRAFHEAKETYARWFDEYFATARHKLGAHMQDLDFGLRIELWNDIETSKIETFVDGAAEIYGTLASLGLPGYIPLPPEPAECATPAFTSALIGFRDAAPAPRAEFAMDPLAGTRPGTLGGRGGTPIHERASQLALVARWVAWDRETLARFESFPRVRRILQARLVTDVVSFADCLMTRPVAAHAPQAMAGFDHLLAAEGGPSVTLSNLTAAFRLDAALDRLRPVRDSFGGHFEVDPAQSLGDLITRVDGTDWADVVSTFEILRAAFGAACMERVYLYGYVADGEPVRGGVPSPSGHVAAYDPAAPAPAWPTLRPTPDWTADEFRIAIEAWLTGDEGRRHEAEEAIRSGLSRNIGEEFTVEHSIGLGTSWRRCVFTHAHFAVLNALRTAKSAAEFGQVLELLLTAGRGYPNRAAETLVRYIDDISNITWTGPALYTALGRVAEWDAARQIEPLRAKAVSGQPWDLRRAAILGLFEAFVRYEGLHRINSQAVSLDFGREVEPWVSHLPLAQELELLLAMASGFWKSGLDVFYAPFEREIRAVDDRLRTLVGDELARIGRPERADAARKLIAAGDHVGLVLLIAEPPTTAEARKLLELARDGTIVTGRHPQNGRNLACCFWLLEDIDGALHIVERLIARNPGNVDYELLKLELLTNRAGSKEAVLSGVARLRRDFQLAQENLARVAAIEASPEP